MNGKDGAAAGRVRFTYDGKSFSGVDGDSLAAALTAAGVAALRHAADGSRRGVFCGMGVCQECVVTVNGKPGQRACMTQLQADAVVESRARPGATVPADAAAGRRDAAPDLLIVGAGAAGLTAARVAAEAGLEVMIVDERSRLGGQYYKQPVNGRQGSDDSQFREGRRLIEMVERLSIEILRDAVVWGAFSPEELGVVAGGVSAVLRPKRILLATGAYERGVPMPGWTLPGVMSTGAVQTLLRAYQVTPGQRVIVGGNGPLNLQVAAELIRTGVEVVALAEAATRPGVGTLGAAWRALQAAPNLVAKGFRDLALLRRRGVAIHYGHVVARIDGGDRVEAVTLMRLDVNGLPVAGSDIHARADVVCMGFGFLPQNELARGLGCAHTYDPRFDQLTVERDVHCRTSMPSVFVAGDAGGLGGARIAAAQGAIAAYAVARDLGGDLTASQEQAAANWQQQVARQQRFQSALWEIYRAPVLSSELAGPDTHVCRCESVSKAALATAISDGATTIGQLKRDTRAGMGPCQGRYCGPVMARMIADHTGRPIDEDSYFAPRSPARPIAISAIAEPVEG